MLYAGTFLCWCLISICSRCWCYCSCCFLRYSCCAHLVLFLRPFHQLNLAHLWQTTAAIRPVFLEISFWRSQLEYDDELERMDYIHIEKYCAIFGTWLFTRWVVSFYSEHFLVVMYSGCSFLPFSLTRCLFSSALKHISISLHVWSQPGPIQTQCIWWAISSTFLLLFFMIGDAPRESTREQQPMETSTMQQTMNRYAQCTWIVRRTKRKIELEQLIITI